MKRILSLILALAMLLSVGAVAYAEEASTEEFVIPEKVEISFKVGDSTLMINGNPVEVETPYIAGEGTTLVPLRVITEAFGARVTWVDATKEIILEYPDVNITLQIGNVNAVVNNHTETLPVAPALSPNGVTMVPLRFISETFGATVGYDNETAAITVVKETEGEDDMISSSTDLPRIGDSYWNWSMLTPQGMMMTERLSDGSATVFEDEAGSVLYLDIYELSEEDDFDEDFSYVKTNFSSYTLSKAEKGKDQFGNSTMYFIARTKTEYAAFRSIYTDKYCYDIAYYCEAGSESIPTLTAIVDSFKVEFAADEAERAQTHDLSNVDEFGYRTIEDAELKLKFKLPAQCVDMELDTINSIAYVSSKSDEHTGVVVSVYSKTEEVTSKNLVEADRTFRDKYYNKQFSSVSTIHPYAVTEVGENAYYFWQITKGLYGGDYEMYAVYFEKGDYVYCITVVVDSGDNQVFKDIMESFTAEVLNSDEAGIYLYTEKEYTPYVSSTSKWSLTLNSSWYEYSKPTTEGATYINLYVGSVFGLMIMDGDGYSFSSLRRVATSLVSGYVSDGAEVTKEVTTVELGGTNYYTFQVLEIDEKTGEGTYFTTYMTMKNNKVYVFSLLESASFANAGANEEAEEIIASLKIVK